MKHDEVNSTLSQWIDGELEQDAAMDAMDDCLQSQESQVSYASYMAIRAAIRGETSPHWQADFSDKVAQAIAQEPTVLAPRAPRRKRSALVGWAVAASVTFAVVLGTNWLPSSGPESLSPAAGPDKLLAEYHVTDDESAQLERINSLFDKFSSQAAAQNNNLPTVRLVSGEQVKTFRMTPQQFRQVMMELEKRNREAEIKAQQELNKQP
ncbi:MAG: hypothetical protein HWE13_08220 [Gammaproteobacteria bacterium]|nr:hypothetical protein [Gammaproteobacteria bacterium]NVK88098.1 hypothetical protein [Gammaproteobacteria bacterium]